MIKQMKMKCVVVICVVAQVATVACAAVRAEVVSLDGTWQAEVAPDAQGETLPTAFTRTIPVPAKWRVTPALPARTRYIFVEISDISPNKLASIEEIEIH